MAVAAALPAPSSCRIVESVDMNYLDNVSMPLRVNLAFPRSASSSAQLFDFQPALFVLQRLCQQARTGVDGVDVGRGSRRDPAQLHDGADERVELEGAAVLDVLKHGSLVLANPLCAGNPPFQRDPEMDAELLADHLRFLHHPGRQFPARRELANVDQGRVAKRTDRIEADVAPELEPDLGADVADHRRLESRLAEKLRDHLYSRRLRAVQFANRESVALDLANQPRRDDLGGRVDHAADHAIHLDMGSDHSARIDGLDPRPRVRPGKPEKIPPGDAVLHGHHDRVATEERSHLAGHPSDLVGFHRQDDNILHTGLGDVVGGSDRARMPLGAILQDQPDPIFPCRLQACSAADESHLLSNQSKLNADHPSDRASPNYTNLHEMVPDNQGGPVRASLPRWLSWLSQGCLDKPFSSGSRRSSGGSA